MTKQLAAKRDGRAKTNSDEDLTVTILKDLVAMPTLTVDAETNIKGLDYIESFLAKRGMHVVRELHKGRGVLVATVRPTKTPKVMLVAHLDVVPAPSDFFEVREKDGKLFGRGVWDMKHAIAAFLVAVDQLQEQLSKLDFGILIYTDDEAGDEQLEYLLQKGYGCEAVVLPDGGEDWQIESMAKGLYKVGVRISGKSSHGSRPWEGDSASLRMVDLLHDLHRDFDGHGPETDTLNVGYLHSGTAAWNQLPDSAEAILDIRLMGEEREQAVKLRLEELAEKHGAAIEMMHIVPTLIHDREHQYLQHFATCIYEVTGVRDEGFMSFGASSAQYFLRRGIPCIITSPPGGNRHGENEWIDKQGLLHFPEVIVRYLKVAALA